MKDHSQLDTVPGNPGMTCHRIEQNLRQINMMYIRVALVSGCVSLHTRIKK